MTALLQTKYCRNQNLPKWHTDPESSITIRKHILTPGGEWKILHYLK